MRSHPPSRTKKRHSARRIAHSTVRAYLMGRPGISKPHLSSRRHLGPGRLCRPIRPAEGSSFSRLCHSRKSAWILGVPGERPPRWRSQRGGQVICNFRAKNPNGFLTKFLKSLYFNWLCDVARVQHRVFTPKTPAIGAGQNKTAEGFPSAALSELRSLSARWPRSDPG